MRICRVSGENLASLGAFAVDFESDPLGGTGLFAITGPTGAGKSTLLDAICLALFDELPRLTGADSDARVGHGGEAASGRLLTSHDVRGIVRHGAVRAHAEVEFVGQDRQRYRARWEVRRARQRASEALRAQVVTLSGPSGEPIGDGKKDTLAEIQKRIGLDFQQFSRAVLLAQGDFDSFIKAKSRDRAQLLERLTGTHVYAELSRQAFERHKQEQENLRTLETRIAEHRPLSQVERAQHEERAAAASARVTELGSRASTLEAALDWYRADDDLGRAEQDAAGEHLSAVQAEEAATPARAALDVARRSLALRAEVEAARRTAERSAALVADVARLASALAVAEHERAAALETERALRDRAIEARERHDGLAVELERAARLDAQVGEADAACTGSAADLERARGELEAAAGRHAALTERRDSTEREIDAHERWLASNTASARLAERSEAVLADLDDLSAILDSMATSERAAAGHESRARQLAAERSEAEAALAAKQAGVDQLEQHAGPLRRSLDAVDRQRLRVADEALRELRDALRLAGDAAVDALEAGRTLAECQRQMVAAHARVTAERATVDEAGATLPVCQARLDEARRAMERSQAADGEAAQALRALLEPGQACPVCGSVEHAFRRHESPLHGRLEADRRRVAELQAEVDGWIGRRADAAAASAIATAELRRLDEQVSAANERITGSRRDWMRARAMIGEQARLARLDLGELAESPDAETARSEVGAAAVVAQRAADELAELRDRLARDQSALEALDAELVELRAERDAGSARLAALRTSESEAAGAALVERRSSVDGARHQRRLEDRLGPLLEPAFGDWKRELVDARAEFVASCGNAVAEYRAHGEALDVARRGRDAVAVELAAVTARRTAAEGAVAAASGLHAERTERLVELRAERTSVIDGRPVADVRDESRVRVTGAEASAAAAGARLAEAERALAAARASETDAREAHARALREDESARRSLAERLAGAGLDLVTVEAALAQGEGSLDVEQRRLDGVRERLTRATATLDERRRARAVHAERGRPDLERVTAAAAAAQVAMELADAETARTAALAALQSDDQARAAVTDLERRLSDAREAARVWAQLNELIGSSDGAKFRRFAQSLTLLRLLELANHHLRDLAPRYALERAPEGELSLQVIDHYMGDEVRGVHNLSGGERFLVSLALALGLASMSTAQGIRVESLFIDEGFGALDGESLSLAVSALESLQATGRKVGIISHVEELKERIAVQVQVRPRGRGESEIHVVTS